MRTTFLPACVISLAIVLASLASDQQGDSKKASVPAVDLYGDPLPDGAVARLGTTRFRAWPPTTALTFSPDDRFVAAVSGHPFGSAIWIWDAITGQVMQHISQSGWERHFAFSPNGKKIFAGTAQLNECSLRIIDVVSGKVAHQFKRPDKESQPFLVGMAFSPDGKTVAAAGRDNRSRIFLGNVETGQQVGSFTGDAGDDVTTMRYSPDGKFIATGGAGKLICIWEVATGKIIRRLDEYKNKPPSKEIRPLGDSGGIDFLSFRSDGNLLASLGQDLITRIWDLDSGNVLRRIEGDLATMRRMAYSKDGRLVATGGQNGSIYLWDAITGKQIRSWHAHPTDIHNLTFSHDGKTLASSGRGDASIRRWQSSTGKEIGTISGHTGAARLLRFGTNGRTLLSCARDSRTIEWDLATFKETLRLFDGSMGPLKDGWSVECADLSPDGKVMVATGSWWTAEMPIADTTIRFFDVMTGIETRTWQLPGKDPIDLLRFSPDGNQLVSGGRKGGTRLWDVVTGKQLRQFTPGNLKSIVAWSPNGQRLAFTESRVDTGRTIVLWDIVANKELRRWDSGQWHVEDLCFAPDDKSIVSTSVPSPFKDRTDVRVWDSVTGALLASFAEHVEDSASRDTNITTLGISSNGRVLAVGVQRQNGEPATRKYYCKVHLFDMFSRQEIRKFDVPQGKIWSLAFGADGRILATGGTDAAILLWDLGAYANPGSSKVATITEKDLDSLWLDLAGNAPTADKAIWTLAAASKLSTPLLKDRMQIAAASPAEVAKLIASIGSDSFTEREKASQALDKLADTAEAAVRKHVEGNITLEVRQRLQQFLINRDKDAIRKLRAIEVLELIGTAESRQVLQTLAKDAPNPRVLEGAAGALARLTKRNVDSINPKQLEKR